MGVVGAAIKGFGKALKIAKRNKASKQVFKNPKYKPSQKALKEAMSKKPKKGINYKKIAIKTVPIGAAAAAGESYGRHRSKK